jgi:hypothetical protein
VLAAGCGGGGSDGRSEACLLLDIGPISRTAEASRALRGAVNADRAALASLDADDPLAARFRGAKATAEQALASFSSDPLRSGSMSPTTTLLPTAQRVIAETRSLRKDLCG